MPFSSRLPTTIQAPTNLTQLPRFGGDLTRIGPPKVEKGELNLGAKSGEGQKGSVLPVLLIVGALAYLYFRGRK